MSKRSSVPLESFLDALATGHPVLDTLHLTSADFSQATQQELLSNPDDIGDGVVAVEKKFDTLFFDMFDGFIIKRHDDGTVRYFFFTTTRDADFIIKLSQLLFQKFEQSSYDSDKFSPFTDKEKVSRLSRGKYTSPKDALVQVWMDKRYNISMSYLISPMRQLMLLVTDKPERQPDLAVRSKGTIADLLKLDLHTVFAQPPIDKQQEIEDGVLRFTDFYFSLSEPVLRIFDVLKVRIFGQDPTYSPQADVSLFFSTSDVVAFEQMLPIVERLIRMYGPDLAGSNQLEPHEIDEIQQEKYWMGRTWMLNEQHGMYDPSAEGQKSIYIVWLALDESSNGFTLDVTGYNKMLEYFTAS